MDCFENQRFSRNDINRSSVDQEIICHPELVSGSCPDAYGKSKTNIISSMSERADGQIPNQVRNDVLKSVSSVLRSKSLRGGYEITDEAIQNPVQKLDCHADKSARNDSHSGREDHLISSKTLTNSSHFTNHSSLTKRAAFTLAEVLITLGIIGVVAAMTLPTLIQNYKEKQTVTQLEKTYSMLSQAWQMMQLEYGEIDSWGVTNSIVSESPEGERVYDFTAQSLIAERMRKYLKVSKICQPNVPCFNKPTYIDGNKTSDALTIKASSDSPADANFILGDGTFIGVGHWVDKKLNSLPTGSAYIYVILPGHKKIVGGESKFFFRAGANGIFPFGDKRTQVVGSTKTAFDTQCYSIATGASGSLGCAAWVINNKNLDYLRCRDKLGWNKASSCKE